MISYSQYMFNPETGEWRHRQHQVFRDRKWLGSISYSSGQMIYPTPPAYGGAPPENYEVRCNILFFSSQVQLH